MPPARLNRRQFIKGSALAWAAARLLPGQVRADTFFGHHKSDFGPMPAPAPAWLRNAVIAEVPTRGFNVSDYKNPSRWKGPYGDTTYRGIAAKLDYLQSMGFNVLCIYSVYSCTPVTNLYALRYDAPNPDMGTWEDVKYLTDQAHARGMRIMSNTNHYGVALTSPLLAEHPHWFLPENEQISGQRLFDLNQPAALAYIIDSHVRWCVEGGLDGWRIDLGSNVFKRSIWSEIVARCLKRGKALVLAPENRALVGYIQGSGKHGYPPVLDLAKSAWVAGATANDPYRVKEVSGHNAGENHDPNRCVAFNSRPNSPCGPGGCFKIQGSQFRYGHDALFAPMVPWMLVGETFNATHLGLPVMHYMPKMLHSYLDWTEAEAHSGVVGEFRKLGRIRTENQDIFHNNLAETKLLDVPFSAVPSCPVVPYVRYISGQKAGVVIGNNSATDDIAFTLKIPLGEMGLDQAGDLQVTDCWTGVTTKVSPRALASYPITVPKDKSPGGGTRVLLIAANAASA